MTIAHALITVSFICFGAAGIASIQDGLATILASVFGKQDDNTGETATSSRAMEIV